MIPTLMTMMSTEIQIGIRTRKRTGSGMRMIMNLTNGKVNRNEHEMGIGRSARALKDYKTKKTAIQTPARL